MLELSGLVPGFDVLGVDPQGRVDEAGGTFPDQAPTVVGRPIHEVVPGSAGAALRERILDPARLAEGFVAEAVLQGASGAPRAVRLVAIGREGGGALVLVVPRWPGAEVEAFESLLAASPDAALGIVGGRIVAANAAARTLLDGDPVGSEAQDVVVADDLFVVREALGVVCSGRAVRRRVGLALHGAVPRRAEVSFSPARIGGKPAVLALLRPAPDEQATCSPAHAEAFARAAHDLGSPLVAARGYVQMTAEGRMGPVEAAQRDVLERACRALDRGTRLCASLGALARAGAAPPAAPVPCPLDAIVAEAFAAQRCEAQRREVELVVDPGPPDAVPLADPDGMARVIDNLVANAVAYNLPGGHVRVTWAHGAPGCVTIEVGDSGVGIPANEQRAVFEPFRRGSSSFGTSGSGLGLATVRAVAVQHGARIDVHSVPGAGTRFVLEWPSAPVAAQASVA